MKNTYTLLFCLFLILFSLSSYAQPDPPNNPTPIDGGISLLIAAGAAYGYYCKKKKP